MKISTKMKNIIEKYTPKFISKEDIDNCDRSIAISFVMDDHGMFQATAAVVDYDNEVIRDIAPSAIYHFSEMLESLNKLEKILEEADLDNQSPDKMIRYNGVLYKFAY
jgi:hypothetical protein